MTEWGGYRPQEVQIPFFSWEFCYRSQRKKKGIFSLQAKVQSVWDKSESTSRFGNGEGRNRLRTGKVSSYSQFRTLKSGHLSVGTCIILEAKPLWQDWSVVRKETWDSGFQCGINAELSQQGYYSSRSQVGTKELEAGRRVWQILVNRQEWELRGGPISL